MTILERNPYDISRTPNISPKNKSTEDIEIELEEPESAVDSSYPDNTQDKDEVRDHYENLVKYIDEDELERLSSLVIDGLQEDEDSRADWLEVAKKGFQNLGMKLEELNEPFEGACSATHPIILESAVKFQSKATSEILPSNGPVKTKVLGLKTEEKIGKAKRVKDFMNYQILELMPEYYPDMERMLFYLPLYGAQVKKCYWDADKGSPCSEFIPIENFVIHADEVDIGRSRRYSHLLPKTIGELRQDFASGKYYEHAPNNTKTKSKNTFSFGASNSEKKDTLAETISSELGVTTKEISGGIFEISDNGKENLSDDDENTQKILVEQYVHVHVKGVSDESGFVDPFCITVEKETGRVLAVKRNWKKGDSFRRKRDYFVKYPYVPGPTFYGVGLIHLLGNYQATMTSIIRSLVDAGQFANLQGGFKAKGLRILNDDHVHGPGEWKEVEATGMDLQKSLFPLTYKEPSQVLFAVLQYLDGRGQKFADSTEQVIADSTNYGPVGTTVALLDASMKFFSAIHKRLHYAQKQELKIIAQLNAEYLPESYPYQIEGEDQNILNSDFLSGEIDIVPVSDPNITSQSHRLSLAQAKLQAALQSPQIHDLREVYKEFYVALDADNTDRILPLPEQAKPLDPLSDIMMASKNKPIGAFPGQDHAAHVAFKQAWMEDPLQGGANPVFQQIIPLVQGNIREHYLLLWQEQIAGMAKQGGVEQAMQNPKVQEKMLAMIGQKLAEINKSVASNPGDGDPARVLAAAEMIKAKIAEKAQEFKEKEALTNFLLKAEDVDVRRQREVNRAAEAGTKADMDQFELGAGLIEKGMKQGLEKDKIKAMRDKPLRNPKKPK